MIKEKSIMKTGKFTVIAIASILGAIALTGCGRAVETSRDAGKVQPAAQTVQTTEAVQTDNAAVTTEAAVTAPAKSAEQNANAAALSNNDVISYNADTNTASYTQQPAAQAPVQQAAPAYKAASSAEQAAADNAIAYAGGNGRIVSSETVQTSDGSAAYRFGIIPVDNANAAAWYYIAGENFAMTDGEWISKQDTLTKEEWEHYYDSAEHRFAFASQQAGQNAIAASGFADGLIVSCDFVNYDYDKLSYAFKVGVRPMSDPNANITYFIAGTDYAEKF